MLFVRHFLGPGEWDIYIYSYETRRLEFISHAQSSSPQRTSPPNFSVEARSGCGIHSASGKSCCVKAVWGCASSCTCWCNEEAYGRMRSVLGHQPAEPIHMLGYCSRLCLQKLPRWCDGLQCLVWVACDFVPHDESAELMGSMNLCPPERSSNVEVWGSRGLHRSRGLEIQRSLWTGLELRGGATESLYNLTDFTQGPVTRA